MDYAMSGTGVLATLSFINYILTDGNFIVFYFKMVVLIDEFKVD